ncbi:MAG: ADP-ribosylglycohydrolase family protein [Actinomycetota bacterium]
MTDLSLADRVAGCLLGGACGDALGAPLEFLDAGAVAALDTAAIAGMLPAYKRQGGAITDDTQMTLFTAEAVIEMAERGELDDREQLEIVADAYLRWYETQTRRHRRSDTGLLTDPTLFAQRAPGHTCMTALRKLAYDGELQATNDSKGCGTVMRAAPFGLVDRVALAGPASDLTHGHPTAAAASVALAEMIRRLLLGRSMMAAVTGAMDHLAAPDHPDHRPTIDALRSAVRLAEDGPPSQATVESLGGAWVAEEALAIAVLCALTGEGWSDTLVRAVTHGGDSDSTGAIAGNLLGAAHGALDLPSTWLDRLEARITIETMAEALTAAIESSQPC